MLPEEKELLGRKDDADEVRALASRLEEQEKEMERLKKKREDRKGIEKKEWFGRTSRVSSNTRIEGEIVTEEGGSRFICNDILWVNYEEKLETNICFEEAYKRFHTGMLRGNIKYRNNKKEVEVPVCDR